MKSCIAALGLAALLSLAPAVVSAEPVKLAFVQINDLYNMSEAQGRGGFARLAAVIGAERAAGKHVLVVHAGDALSPSLMSGFDQGEHMIALLNVLKPDVLVPGNHEFDFGPEVYAKRISEAQFPILAANLRGADGKPLPGHKDHEILDVEGLKVGIVGAAAEDSPVKSSPGSLVFAPTFDTIAAEAKALKADGADIVVAVAHANMALDWRIFNARLVDVLLTGDDHDLRVEYDGRTVMVESGEDAQYVTVTELSLDKQVKDGKTSFSWRPDFRIIDTASVTPDPAMAAKVKVYEDQLTGELNVAVAKLDEPLDSHTASVRTGETAVGDLIADALRASTGADVGITNGGGIRGNKAYAAGSELTRRDVLTELPFGNKTVLVQITGAALLAAIENGLGKLPEPSGRFPQVSGITVEADLSKPAGSRVLKLLVAGKPLDPAATYKVATNDFMLRGGDGYTMLAAGTVLLRPEDGKLIANDVMVLARKLGHIAAKVEGRVVLKN